MTLMYCFRSIPFPPATELSHRSQQDSSAMLGAQHGCLALKHAWKRKKLHHELIFSRPRPVAAQPSSFLFLRL